MVGTGLGPPVKGGKNGVNNQKWGLNTRKLVKVFYKYNNLDQKKTGMPDCSYVGVCRRLTFGLINPIGIPLMKGGNRFPQPGLPISFGTKGG